MTKKKKNDSGGMIFFIIFIALIIIAIATPLVLLIGYVYNTIRFRYTKKRISGNMSDFWLGKQEKDEFKEKAVMLNKVTDIINEANQKGLKAGISQNKDGSFSARSNIGKEIRNTLEKYEPIKTSVNHTPPKGGGFSSG